MSPAAPPSLRSRAALGLAAAAAHGRLELQVCEACGTVQYPPREACRACFCGELVWRPQSGEGTLLSETLIHRSMEPFFQQHAPWRMGAVKLDCGPCVIAHIHADCAPAPARTRIEVYLDRNGVAVLIAMPGNGVAPLADQRLRSLLR